MAAEGSDDLPTPTSALTQSVSPAAVAKGPRQGHAGKGRFQGKGSRAPVIVGSAANLHPFQAVIPAAGSETILTQELETEADAADTALGPDLSTTFLAAAAAPTRFGEPVVPEPVVPEPVLPDPSLVELAVPELAVPELAVPELAVPELAVPELALPEPVAAEPFVAAIAEPSPMAAPAAAVPTDFPIPAVASAVVPVSAEVTAAVTAVPGAPTTPTYRNKNLEIAMTTTHDFLTHGQANVEAVIKSSQIWSSGVQDIGRSIAESAQAQFDHSVATWKALAGTKSLKEAFDIQSSRARAAMEKAVADSSKMTDASLKLAEQAMAPITARITVATESFSKPA